MNETNRNMIIAIVLSVVVLFGWQFFIAGPQLQRQQQQAEIAAQQAAAACSENALRPARRPLAALRNCARLRRRRSDPLLSGAAVMRPVP